MLQRGRASISSCAKSQTNGASWRALRLGRDSTAGLNAYFRRPDIHPDSADKRAAALLSATSSAWFLILVVSSTRSLKLWRCMFASVGSRRNTDSLALHHTFINWDYPRSKTTSSIIIMTLTVCVGASGSGTSYVTVGHQTYRQLHVVCCLFALPIWHGIV
jgi:hypothetical protein